MCRYTTTKTISGKINCNVSKVSVPSTTFTLQLQQVNSTCTVGIRDWENNITSGFGDQQDNCVYHKNYNMYRHLHKGKNTHNLLLTDHMLAEHGFNMYRSLFSNRMDPAF